MLGAATRINVAAGRYIEVVPAKQSQGSPPFQHSSRAAASWACPSRQYLADLLPGLAGGGKFNKRLDGAVRLRRQIGKVPDPRLPSPIDHVAVRLGTHESLRAGRLAQNLSTCFHLTSGLG
jgi:hypothetical protein